MDEEEIKEEGREKRKEGRNFEIYYNKCMAPATPSVFQCEL